MRVDENSTTQNRVHCRVERAGGKGSDGKGNQTGGEEALEGPVVGTMGGVGLGDRGRVVDCDMLVELVIFTCASIRTSTLDLLCRLVSKPVRAQLGYRQSLRGPGGRIADLLVELWKVAAFMISLRIMAGRA